jgi:hypothetical protein
MAEENKAVKSSTLKALCNPLWALGLIFQLLGVIIQMQCLPYADLTLIACNCTFAILFL